MGDFSDGSSLLMDRFCPWNIGGLLTVSPTLTLVLTLLTLRKQPGVYSENVSFSWGLVAKLVLTLFEIKSNLGFRHDVVGLLMK